MAKNLLNSCNESLGDQSFAISEAFLVNGVVEKSPMSRVQEELPALFALAYERSETARVNLANKLVSLFLAEDVDLTDREAGILNDLIDQLLNVKNPVIRHEISQKFANASQLPRKLAINLASKPIDIATAILINNTALNDNDLISIVDSQSTDHVAAVARRKQISEAVADALVATGNIAVMQLVSENLGARLSPKAITVLTEAARMHDSLQHPVMYRPELTSEAAMRLYWWVTQDLRRFALQRFNITSGQVDKELSKTIEQKLQDHALEKFDDMAMAKVAAWLDERKFPLTSLLPQILRMGHFRLFHLLLARMAKLEIAMIDKIISEPGGRLMAVICRAFQIDKATFVSVFLLARGARADEQVVHPRELSLALAAYDRLTQPNAQDLLRSWQQDPACLSQQNDSDSAHGT
jgi:uncharacterized protein (DUF2336 family)